MPMKDVTMGLSIVKKPLPVIGAAVSTMDNRIFRLLWRHSSAVASSPFEIDDIVISVLKSEMVS